MRHPCDNIGPFGPTENALELGRELLKTHGMSVVDDSGRSIRRDVGSGSDLSSGDGGRCWIVRVAVVAVGIVALDALQVVNVGVVLVEIVRCVGLSGATIAVACVLRGSRGRIQGDGVIGHGHHAVCRSCSILIDSVVRGWSAGSGSLRIVRINAALGRDIAIVEIGSGLSGGGGSAGGDGTIVKVAAVVVHEDELHCRAWMNRS